MELSNASINTTGGAVVGESVNTQGGTFVGRDQTIFNVQVHFTPISQHSTSHEQAPSDLHVINFTRPLTGQQCAQIEESVGQAIGVLIDVTLVFDESRAFAPQCVTCLDKIGLTRTQWQTLPIIVNLPGLTAGAACLLAELHGRMGHFPSVVRLSQQSNNGLASYSIIEVIDIQNVRTAAHKRQK